MAVASPNYPKQLANRTCWAVAITLIVIATALGLITAGDNILEIDWRFSRWVQQWDGNVPAALHRTGDMLGDTPVAVATVLALIIIAAVLKSKRFTAFFVAVGLMRLVGLLLKPIFNSARPVEEVPIMPEVRIRIYEAYESTGYPSGHSMTAAMFSTVAVILIWNSVANGQTRWIVTALAAVYMLFVGWTRIWSGAHWPTDVVGGLCYGVAFVLIARAITTRFAGERTESESPQSQELQQPSQ